MLLAIGKDTPWLRRTLDGIPPLSSTTVGLLAPRPGADLAYVSLFCWKTEGYRFRLCLFPEVQARQATWDGVFELVRDTFPEAWPKVAPHIHVRVLFLIALLLQSKS